MTSPNVSPELSALSFKASDPPRPPEFSLESAVDNEDPSEGELRQRLHQINRSGHFFIW